VGEGGEEELLVTKLDLLLSREVGRFCEESIDAGLKPVLIG